MSPGKVRAIPPTFPKVRGRLPCESVAAPDSVIDVDEAIVAMVVPAGMPGPVTGWPTASPAVVSIPVTMALPDAVVAKRSVESVAVYWFAAPPWFRYSA